jgi:hypothetical protein
MDKVAIERITIKIGEVEHSLTVEQARELSKTLAELFGGPAVVAPYPVYRPWVYIPWTTPPILPTWTVTCGSDSVNVCSTS